MRARASALAAILLLAALAASAQPSPPASAALPASATSDLSCCSGVDTLTFQAFAAGRVLDATLADNSPRLVFEGEPRAALPLAFPEGFGATAITFKAARVSAGLKASPGTVFPVFLFLDVDRKPIAPPVEPKDVRNSYARGSGIEGWVHVPAGARHVVVIAAPRYARSLSFSFPPGPWPFNQGVWQPTGQPGGELQLRLFGS